MRKIILLLIFASFYLISFSKTTIATGSGFWLHNLYDNVTWSNGSPATGDIVIINNGVSITGGTNVSGPFPSITLQKLIVKGSLSFDGILIVTDSLIISNVATSASLSLNNNGPYNFNEIHLKSSNGNAFFSVGPGITVNISGSITQDTKSTLSANSPLILSGGSNNQSVIGSGYSLDLSSKTGGTVSLGQKFSLSSAITVPSGVTLNIAAGDTIITNGKAISGAGNLTVASGGRLDISGASSFPAVTTTTLSSGSTVEYSNSGAQTVSNKAYYNLTISGSGTKTVTSGATVEGIVTVNGTANLACGTGYLTILSSASGTAAIGQVAAGASVAGSPTIERYVSDMSSAGNPGWWYFLGAPVSGQTIANISDDIATSGFTGSDFPTNSFVSISRWTGSAYTNATNTTNNMNLGEGWFVYMGSSDPAYDIPETISWIGNVTTGDYSGFSISSTGAEYTSLSNPYPSAVTFDLSSMPNSNVQNPYVVNNDGSFLALTNGSTLGLAQGFYIETASNGAASLTFRESDKLGSVEGNSVFNKSSKSFKVIKPRLSAEITKVNGEVDFSYLELDDTKTLGMDYPADFDKYENFNGYTNIFFKQNGHNVHINNIPSNIGSGVSIPIHLSRAYPNGSNVTLPIRINGVEDFRKEGICLTLEETATGNMTTLMNDYNNTIVWNDNDTNAVYILHFSKPFEESTTSTTCYGFEDGSASANAFVTAKYDFYLTNLIGDTLQSEMGKVANSHTFNNVKAGKYNLVVNDPNGCGLLAKPVEVTEPDPVLSFFTTPKNSIDLSVNPELKFSNHSANAQSYLWHFGDGNSSMDFEPIHNYNAVGTYEVNLVAYNGSCTDTSKKSVVVENNAVGIYEVEENKNLELFQANEKIELRFDLIQRELINARLVNVLGQEVWSSQGKTIQNEQLNFNLPEENTIYLLTIKGESFESNYKLIRK